MSRKVLLWLMALVVILPALGGVGYWFYWDQFLRYKPVTITKNLTEIQTLLDQADYVSPGKSGPALYLVTYHACKACREYEEQEFPRFDAVNADTRVIVFARADNQGLSQSTPAERSTVAELWITRNWQFYQAWDSSSDTMWKADGLVVSDNDMARNAVVGASRDFVNRLVPLLGANGVRISYPLLLWRDSNNRLKVCACSNDKAYHFIREDLGVSTGGQGVLDNINDNLDSLKLPFGSENSSASAAPVPANPAAQTDANPGPTQAPAEAKP
ncbi:MAG: hypothetical protein WDN06_21910 [Asticcacaulis sp.]